MSRGKVSSRKEKEKRNSIYLQEAPTTPVEVRRTLEAVRYFRKLLEDETTRLLSLCDKWLIDKTENLERLLETGADGMIDVTIGQAKLLTSKKFVQFKGLIDRCEAGATGVGAIACDGSEDTKPVNAVDLEGFWSMLGIQASYNVAYS